MPDGDTLILGKNNSSTATTSISRNDPTPQPALEVENQGSGEGLVGRSTDDWGVHGSSLNHHGVSGVSSNQPGILGYSSKVYGVLGFGNGTASGMLGHCTDGFGVLGQSPNANGVRGESTYADGVSGFSPTSSGVSGKSTNASGVYGENTGGGPGVSGRAAAGEPAVLGTNGGAGDGVQGISERGFGVFGHSTDSFGVVGNTTSGLAGLFNGGVHVLGNLWKLGGGFRIDHPLDPANMYLNHSFIESPQRRNLYDGVSELGEDGSAWVELPEWFEELNRDFRYQLTAIGSPAPELHVAEEISEKRFKIAGGERGGRVSWQVTGVRKDRWAEANPI